MRGNEATWVSQGASGFGLLDAMLGLTLLAGALLTLMASLVASRAAMASAEDSVAATELARRVLSDLDEHGWQALPATGAETEVEQSWTRRDGAHAHRTEPELGGVGEWELRNGWLAEFDGLALPAATGGGAELHVRVSVAETTGSTALADSALRLHEVEVSWTEGPGRARSVRLVALATEGS